MSENENAARGPVLGRRDFVRTAAFGAAAVAGLSALKACGTGGAVTGVVVGNAVPELAVLPPLPYAEDALAPVISSEAMAFHYGKHHAAYARNLTGLLAADPGRAKGARSLEALIVTTAGDPDSVAVFNNAAQLWNHTFYWKSLSPAPRPPSAELTRLLDRDLGGREGAERALREAALGQFGSGWAWLAMRDGKLVVTATPDAESPLHEGMHPLLTIDVWEHAYYIDYRNERGTYTDALIADRLDWGFASERLAT